MQAKLYKSENGRFFLIKDSSIAKFEDINGVLVLTTCFDKFGVGYDIYVDDIMTCVPAERKMENFKIPHHLFYLFKDILEDIGFKISINITFGE